MQKLIIREYASYYGYRWSLAKHNRNNKQQKLISLYDRLILDKLMPGSTLCLDSLGCQYQDLISNLDIYDSNLSQPAPNTKYNNVLALNCIFLKYQDLNQLSFTVTDIVNKYVVPAGRLFLSFNFQFVKFNRLKYDFDQEINNWIKDLENQKLSINTKLLRWPRTDPYGDCFFVFELGKS